MLKPMNQSENENKYAYQSFGNNCSYSKLILSLILSLSYCEKLLKKAIGYYHLSNRLGFIFETISLQISFCAPKILVEYLIKPFDESCECFFPRFLPFFSPWQ